jgi:hypothetical protein
LARRRRSATAAPAADAADTATTVYLNTGPGLKGPLRTSYVDVSFRYPSAWTGCRGSATRRTSSRSSPTSGGPACEAGNFAVGWFRGHLSVAPALADQISADLRRVFPAYERLAEGRARFGRYAANQQLSLLPGRPRRH